MNRAVPPPAEEDPFVVNRAPDDELDVSVPFELEASEWDWEPGRSSDGTGESWGAAGDHGVG